MIHTSHFTFTDHIHISHSHLSFTHIFHTYHSHLSFTPIIHVYRSHLLFAAQPALDSPWFRKDHGSGSAREEPTKGCHSTHSRTAPALHQHPACKQQTTSHDPGHGITILHPCVLCVLCSSGSSVKVAAPRLHGSSVVPSHGFTPPNGFVPSSG